ncbi:MAG: KilA-N domain-containing protein [Candidatus Cloacimonetes bacterium]|nr:KilA-N domain-containing protein [Candidatus Cloacimonadota bacterium]
MKKNKKITVLNKDITITSIADEDYISLTDMLKAKDGDFFISDWLRNRNTVEFLGIWERVHNPGFNYGEYAIIRSQAGLNSYKISVKEWVKKTNAIGLTAKAGRLEKLNQIAIHQMKILTTDFEGKLKELV